MVTAIPFKPAVQANNLAMPFNHFAVAYFAYGFFRFFLHI